MLRWNNDEIVRLMLDAGRVALKHYSRPAFDLKPDMSIVTAADTEIEARLASVFDRPSEGAYLVGEETLESRSPAYLERALEEVAWVVDPIDGTAPYAHHIPLWGVSIGRLEAGRLTEGAVFLPATGELFLADARAAWRAELGADPGRWDAAARLEPLVPRPRPLGVDGLVALDQSLAKRGRIEIKNPVHALCSAVLPITYLCLGRYLAYIGKLKLWDYAGGLAVLRRCGLSAVFMDGSPLSGDARLDCRMAGGPVDRWRARDDIVFASSPEVAAHIRACVLDRGAPSPPAPPAPPA